MTSVECGCFSAKTCGFDVGRPPEANRAPGFGCVEAKGSSYAMAKAAINAWCRGLAVELASSGILANAIAPSFLEG